MTPTPGLLFLALLWPHPAAGTAADCALIYELYARASAGGIAASGAGLSAALAECEDEEGSALPAPPPRASAPPSDDCASVRQNRALMLSMGVEDGRFDHLLAECELADGADAFGGAVIGVAGITGARVTSGFGWRWHPIRGRKAFHAGVDLAARRGDLIPALGTGVVRFAGWRGGYGRMVEVEHPVTGAVTRYAHLSRILVRDGDVVKAGQTLGAAGSSGFSTGPHLHLEVLVGEAAVDPTPYLANPKRLNEF